MRPKGAITNGQSRYTDNIGHTRHKTKTNKVRQSTQDEDKQGKTKHTTQHNNEVDEQHGSCQIIKDEPKYSRKVTYLFTHYNVQYVSCFKSYVRL